MNTPLSCILVGLLPLAAGAAEPLAGVPGSTVSCHLTSGGRSRSVSVHIPRTPRAQAPVVLAFHGTGGSAQSMVDVTGLDELAERDGFVVAYPEAIAGTWFDFAKSEVADGNLDFAVDVVDALAATLPIDQRRVYATGLSAGGTMSMLLACDPRGRFAAVAPVAGGMTPETLGRIDTMPTPRSVLMINGRDDAIVPYAGGFLALTWVWVTPAPTTARAFAGRAGCRPWPAWDELPDTAWWDGCRAQRTRWSGGLQGAEVELWTIAGGGHTWPGSRTWLPGFLFGSTCYDFDATATIWAFFQRHPLTALPSG